MAVYFFLATGPWEPGITQEAEFMHLVVGESLAQFFRALASQVDVADLDFGQLELYGPEGDRSWSPSEALVMAERLQVLYDALRGNDREYWPPPGGLWPSWGRGDWEPPEDAGGRRGVGRFPLLASPDVPRSSPTRHACCRRI
jgi:hypothetical protein